MTDKEFIDPDFEAFTDKEKIFITAYLTNGFNKRQAAKTAGYTALSADKMGIEICNRPHIREYINKQLRKGSSTKDELVSGLSKIANTNMSKYFTIVEELVVPRIRVGLATVIAGLKEKISMEKEYVMTVELDAEEEGACMLRIRSLERQIARLSIELDRNPNATRIVDGEAKLVPKRVPDIAKMVKDKVNLKRINLRKDGSVEVEGYSAPEAAVTLLKLQGEFSDHNAQKQNKVEVNLSGISDAALTELLNAGSK